MGSYNSPSSVGPSPTNSITSFASTPTNITPKPNGGQAISKIVTSKEWVLPPRPKPGRKPSADTPATKRKAQNRAAQRAFRERRATRVTELEEKLNEVEKARDLNELNLKNIINKLSMENKYLLKNLNEVKTDFANFKNSISSNKIQQINGPNTSSAVYANGTVNGPSPLNFFKPSSNLTSEYRQQQIPRRSSHQAISPASRPSNTPTRTPSTNKTSVSSSSGDNYDCGICVKDDCICAEVGIKPQESQPQQQASVSIESFKPMAPVSLKRKQQTEEVEVDYTAKFSKNPIKKPMPKFKKAKKQSTAPIEQNFTNNVFDDFESPMEQCGFCSDDSPCVCREAAKEAASAIAELQNHSKKEASQLPPIRNGSITSVQTTTRSQSSKLPVLHPGPTVEISELHRSSISSTPVEEKPENESTGGCTGNPGTCTQCQLDPMSTLFCTTIASKAETKAPEEGESKKEDKSPVSPPLSSKSSKVSSPTTTPEEELNSLKPSTSVKLPGEQISETLSQKGIFIPCADAYKTLSRHKEFNSVDFSTLVGKLTTRGMQVEVQSVANVLRELDRRLYN